MSEQNKTLKRKQLLYAGAAAVVVLGLAGVWIFSTDNANSNADRAEDLRRRSAMTDVINPPRVASDYLSKTSTQITALQNAVTALQQGQQRMADDLQARDIQLAEARAAQEKIEREATAVIDDLAARVAGAEAGSVAPPSIPRQTGSGPQGNATDPFLRSGVVPGANAAPGATIAPPVEPPTPRTIEIVRFEPVSAALETGVLQPAVFQTHQGDYVPPNAYAEARVLVGVDMSTGVRTAADPKPILLRITGPAYSVLEDGRRLDVDLTGCLVNGAAHAELSSERVFVQLQKITCERGDGEVAESQVEGYIASLGKVGVRGRVVSREGDIVSRALFAGIIGGFGRGISRNTDQLFAAGSGIASGGATTIIGNERLDPGEIAAGSFGEGLSTAADTVADYLIERAEQYQPVIEMPTGIDVEIVFLSGFYARGENS